jgi:hypothetical protein
MNGASVTIHFDGNGRVYHPGETLSGEYRLHGLEPDEIKAIEVSVLWHTRGKGDEDLAVHHFRRLEPDHDGWFAARTTGRFRSVLPNSPLSYQGVIVRIQWCVRVRVFLSQGGEVVGEKVFRLGRVASAKAAAS